jgi:hypothetical protein
VVVVAPLELRLPEAEPLMAPLPVVELDELEGVVDELEGVLRFVEELGWLADDNGMVCRVLDGVVADEELVEGVLLDEVLLEDEDGF